MNFKEKVFEAVARIPKGRVATYGQVAEIAGFPGAARAVGNVIHTNTDPVAVPCHRVVCADGRLGSNYGLGGPAKQRERLEAEGVMFTGPGAGDHVDISRYGITIEAHPLKPFLPATGRILFLGSFPPPKSRWSMEFFYPNWINDFWRIQGLIHFCDAHYFESGKHFNRDRIAEFCTAEGLGFFDTAQKVFRMKGNASDDSLQILQPSDLCALLAEMPDCRTIVTTGGKASEELLENIRVATSVPAVGASIEIILNGRTFRWWRMPSTSRAFPMPLAEKARYYRKLFI